MWESTITYCGGRLRQPEIGIRQYFKSKHFCKLDKGYDSEPLREQIRKTGTKANIPKKTNSQSNNDHMDWYLYKIRHLVENMFCRLKQFRGIATRYDKLKRNYQSSVALACIFLWLPL